MKSTTTLSDLLSGFVVVGKLKGCNAYSYLANGSGITTSGPKWYNSRSVSPLDPKVHWFDHHENAVKAAGVAAMTDYLNVVEEVFVGCISVSTKLEPVDLVRFRERERQRALEKLTPRERDLLGLVEE